MTVTKTFSKQILSVCQDVATVAWLDAVADAGGSVSLARALVWDALLVGLRLDGILPKLDALWLYSAENQTSALIDLVALRLATAVNSPTFTIDRGFTGNASNMSIDSNFNPSTAISPKFVQNSACMFCWDVTANNARSGLFGYSSTTVDTRLFVSSGVMFPNINNVDAGSGFVDPATAGLFVLTTPNGTSSTLDLNGSLLTGGSGTANAPANFNFVSLTSVNSFSNHQLACFGFGGGLTGADRANLFSRLRTTMTAVGVP
jgi:hypothetical protein